MASGDRSESGQAALVVATGSVADKTFSWRSSRESGSANPADLVNHLIDELKAGKVALGFELTAWLPVSDRVRDLGNRRSIDPGPAWRDPQRAAVTITALEQAGWVLERIANPGRGWWPTTIDRKRWQGGAWSHGRQLLLWEARSGSPGGCRLDPGNADRLIDAFTTGRGPRPPGPALNLLAVTAQWAGLKIRRDETRMRCPAYGLD